MTQTFDAFTAGITKLGGVVSLSEDVRQDIETNLARMSGAAHDKGELARFLEENPDLVPVLGLVIRLSQEQLKNVLRQRFGTSSWRKIALTEPDELVNFLDEEFNLMWEMQTQLERDWTFADVIVERYAPRLRAAGSIQRGRLLEDEVEKIADALALPRDMRTRFVGRGGRTAPCDMALPGGGENARIVCAIKGFDSTGSKLTDGAREIAEMAETRLPNQYVFAIVDGIGWLSRKSDLRRIYALLENQSIDGLYSTASLPKFQEDLRAAAARVGLI